MLIELQEPFKSKWRKGYKLFDNTINRYKVVLYNSETDILNISYARYLMGVFLGYEVPDHLEVDHINNNPLDDRNAIEAKKAKVMKYLKVAEELGTVQ